MKLLLNEDLVWTSDVPEPVKSEFAEFLQSLEAVARKMSVHASFELGEARAKVTIPAQKISLDDIAMNELFDSLLNELFNLELRYATLGGTGCEFAIEVTGAESNGDLI